jgi:hypothetical protein
VLPSGFGLLEPVELVKKQAVAWAHEPPLRGSHVGAHIMNGCLALLTDTHSSPLPHEALSVHPV